MEQNKIKDIIESARKDSLQELDIRGQLDDLGESPKLTDMIPILHKSSLDYTDKMIEKILTQLD